MLSGACSSGTSIQHDGGRARLENEEGSLAFTLQIGCRSRSRRPQGWPAMSAGRRPVMPPAAGPIRWLGRRGSTSLRSTAGEGRERISATPMCGAWGRPSAPGTGPGTSVRKAYRPRSSVGQRPNPRKPSWPSPLRVGERAQRVRLPGLDEGVRDRCTITVSDSASDPYRTVVAVWDHQVAIGRRQTEPEVGSDGLGWRRQPDLTIPCRSSIS